MKPSLKKRLKTLAWLAVSWSVPLCKAECFFQLKDGDSYSYVISYGQESPPVGFTKLFTYNQLECDTSSISCELKDVQCTGPAVGLTVSLSETFPFIVNIPNNVEKGYSDSFCYVCLDSSFSQTRISMSIRQTKKCTSSDVTVVEYLKPRQLIKSNGLSPEVVPITDYFTVLDKEGVCKPHTCVIKDTDCNAVLDGYISTSTDEAGTLQFEYIKDREPYEAILVCIECTAGGYTIVTKQTVMLAGDCNTPYTLDFTLTEKSFPYSETRSSMPISTWFGNPDTLNCLLRCSLKEPDCQTKYTGNELAIQTITMRIMIESSIDRGYTAQFCLLCNSLDNMEQFQQQLKFRQIENCLRTSIVESAKTTFLEVYADNANGYSLGYATDFFTAFKDDECKYSMCVIKDKGCSSIIDNGNVFIDPQDPVHIKAHQNVELGFHSEVCLECRNSETSITRALTVSQYPNCQNTLTPTDQDTHWIPYDSSSTTNIDFSAFYTNSISQHCPINSCEFREHTCTDPSPHADKFEYTMGHIIAQPNNPAGATYSLCLHCHQYGTTTDFKVEIAQYKSCGDVFMTSNHKLELTYEEADLEYELTELDTSTQCTITSCELKQEDCTSSLPDDSHVTLTDFTKLVAKRNVIAGYTLTVCAICQDKMVQPTQTLILVTQEPQCSGTLTATEVETSIEITYEATGMYYFQKDDFYTNSKPDQCPEQCDLLQNDCLKGINTFNMVAAQTLSQVQMRNNYVEGWYTEFCLVCLQLDQTALTVSGISVTQLGQCGSMLVPAQASYSFRFDYYVGDKFVINRDTVFPDIDDSQCSITCTTLQEDCTTPLVHVIWYLDKEMYATLGTNHEQTVDFCFKCSTGSESTNVPFTVIQSMNCANALSFTSSITTPQTFSYSSNKADIIKIATIAEIFSNQDPDNCAISSCDLLSSDCFSPLADIISNSFSLDPSGDLTLVDRTSLQEIEYQLCLSCTNGAQTIMSTAFTVVQTGGCAQSIQKKQDEVTVKFEYDGMLLDGQFQLVGMMADYFDTIEGCGTINCNIESTYQGLSIDTSYIWAGSNTIKYFPQVAEGHTVTLPYTCKNTQAQDTILVIIDQSADIDCSSALSLNTFTSEVTFNYNPTSGATQQIYTIDEMFSNDNPSGCPITSCSLIAWDCYNSLYQDALDVLQLDTSTLTLIKLDTVGGYTHGFCVRCLNKDQQINSGMINLIQAAKCQPSNIVKKQEAFDFEYEYTVSQDFIKVGDIDTFFDTVYKDCGTITCTSLNLAEEANQHDKISVFSTELRFQPNTVEGVSINMKYKCQDAASSDIVLVNIEQGKDCSSALSKTAWSLPAQIINFQSPSVETMVASYTQFFNENLAGCEITSCKLTFYNCMFDYTGSRVGLRSSQDSQWNIMVLETSETGGYIEAFCIRCTNGVQVIESSEFTIQQRPDCSSTIASKDSSTTIFEFEFEVDGIQPLGERSDFFDINEIAGCGSTSCTVLNQGCEDPLQDDTPINFNQEGNQLLQANTGKEQGYSLAFCFKCANEVEAGSVEISVDQTRDCSGAEWLANFGDQDWSFEQQAVPFYSQSIEDNINNPYPSECLINSCTLFTESCDERFDGSELEIRVNSDSMDFSLYVQSLSVTEGFSYTLCIKCEISSFTLISNPFKFTQIQDCKTVASPKDEEFTFSFAFANEPDKLIGSLNSFFNNELPEHCTFGSCSLFKDTCDPLINLAGPEVYLQIKDGEQDVLAKTSVSEGYTLNLCIACPLGGKLFTQAFNVHQVPDCSITIDFEASTIFNQKLSYVKDAELVELFDVGEYITNTAPSACPVLSCKLLAPESTSLYEGRKLTIKESPPFTVAAASDVKMGYTESASIRCQNSASSISRSLTVFQKRSCKDVIEPNRERSKQVVYEYSKSTQTIGDAIDFFVQVNPEGCEQLVCLLFKSDCTSAYEGLVKMTETHPFELSVSLDNEDGFEEEVCIQCSNEDEVKLFPNLLVMQEKKPPEPEPEQTQEQQEQLAEQINLAPILLETPKDISYSIPVEEENPVFKISIPNPLDRNPDMDSMTLDGGRLGKVKVKFENGRMVVEEETKNMEFDTNSNDLVIEFASAEEMNSFQGRNVIILKLTDDKGLTSLYPITLAIQESPELIEYKQEQKEKELEAALKAEEERVDSLTEEQVEAEEALSELEEEIKQLEQEEEKLQEANGGAPLTKQQKVQLQEKKEMLILKKEMVSQGFKVSASGYVFPGVDPAEIDKLNNQITKDIIEQIPEPIAIVQPVSSFGEIKIRFNQEMIAPPTIQQFIYYYAFQVYVISSEDSSIWYGRFPRKSKKAARALEEDEGIGQETGPNLSFNLQVTEHTSQRLVLKMDFEQPSEVSKFESDQLVFKIKDPSLFKSKLTLKVLDKDYNNFEVAKDIPQILMNAQVGRLLQNSTQQANNLFDFVTSSNFVTNLLLKSSMQQLWGLIRALQIIVYQDLIRIPKPSHLQIFFEGCVAFASTDILDGNELFYSRWNFRQSEPLNSNFDRFDFGTMIFTKNSGSFFLLQVFIFGYYPCRWMLTKLALHFSKMKLPRKVGMMINQNEVVKPILYSSQKLLLETYFDICLALCISIVALSEDFSILVNSEQGNPDRIDSALFIITLARVLYFLVYGYVKITQNIETYNKQIDCNIQIYMEGIRHKTKSQALYTIIFLARRLLMACTLVFLREYPIFQLMLLLHMSIANLEYIIHNQPMQTRKENHLEVLDEYTISLIITLNFILIDTSQDVSVRNFQSWVLISLCSINLIFHFVLLFKDTFRKLRLQYYRWRKERTISVQQKQAYTNAGEDLDDSKKKEKHQKLLKFQEAVRYAKHWYPQRRWLLQNGVNISSYPEEVEWQRLNTVSQLDIQQQQYQKMKSIQKAVEHKVNEKVKENFKKRVESLKKKMKLNLEDVESIKEESQVITSKNDIKQIEAEAIEEIVQHNMYNEEFDTNIFIFGFQEVDTQEKLNLINQIQNQHQLDFMVEEQQMEQHVQSLLAPKPTVIPNYSYREMSKFAVFENPCHAQVLWCLMEIPPLADFYLSNPIASNSNLLGTFMSKFYKTLHQLGPVNNVPKIEMIQLTQAMKKQEEDYETWTPSVVAYQVEQAIMDKLNLEIKENSSIDEELFAIDLRYVSKCKKGHTLEKLESFKFGFEVDHTTTLNQQLKDRMTSKPKLMACQCGQQTKVEKFKRYITRFPPYLLIRVNREQKCDPMKYSFFINYLEKYKDPDSQRKQGTRYKLKGQITERTSKEGLTKIRSIVKKRLKTGQPKQAWFRLGLDGKPKRKTKDHVKVSEHEKEKVDMLFYERTDLQLDSEAEAQEEEKDAD